MEQKQLEAGMHELFPVVEELVRGGGRVRLTVTGSSMYPMLRDRTDSVVLAAPPKRLKRYDLPLYRRKNGGYVLHRIVKVKNGTYTMCGDNQTALEEGVCRDQIIAVVQEFCRGGRTISCTHPLYRFAAGMWCILRPLRPRLLPLLLAIRKKIRRRQGH